MSNDGGSAFPLSREQEGWFEKGMSLRDYFAAQVLPSIVIADVKRELTSTAQVAEKAYMIADAMLKERAK